MAGGRIRLRPGQRSALDAMGIARWVPRQSMEDGSGGDSGVMTAAVPAGTGRVVETAAIPAPRAVADLSAGDRPGRADGAAGKVNGDAGSAGAVAEAELARLRVQVAACTRCRLHETRTQTVFGVGNPRATWMVVGEAPGAEEDRQGEPFVGRAGQLLNEMLKAIGLSREEVYIANVLKCRPPENRDPRPDESVSCEEYLQQQIMLVRPRILLAVGRIAAQNLLKTETPIGRLRGHVHRYGPLDTPLVVTYHPAYLLRSPGQKRRAWEDLVLARRTVRAASSS
jgi:uracil-DNA glycosylase family 4